MNDVKVKKDEALAALRKNRASHKQIFDEAVKGYKQKALEVLAEHVKRIQTGSLVRVTVQIPFPEDHTKDYDRAIKMLEMSVEDHVLMDETSFQQYVMDDWHWKRQFLHANKAYSTTATVALAADFNEV